ncbi:MAG: ATP-binding protein [Bacteroidales bacterium]|nr:ATP-binding protein [Bacteroidales bacterium]
MTINPFIITEDYVAPEYFCDREFESSILRSNIINGRNTVLISPRRMGKSGLIAHVIREKSMSEAYTTFTLDLFPTSNLAEMILLLSNEIVGKMKTREGRFLDNFVSVVKSLRPGVKMNPVSGELEFNLSLGEILRPQESLEEIFNYLKEAEKPCLVAIDEFQQIAEYPEKNVIALLRSYVQKCSNARFIFAGSNRRMMDTLFNSPSEPFYMSCSPLYLDVIDREKYWNFTKGHFEAAGRIINRECFDKVYDKFEGHTWYVQRLLNELYERAANDNHITSDTVSESVDYVVKLNGKAFEDQFKSYPEAQKALLIAIAKEEKADGITSIAFVRKHSLKSPSTVQSATRMLYDKEIITKDGTSYCITNRFFAIWLDKVYGSR